MAVPKPTLIVPRFQTKKKVTVTLHGTNFAPKEHVKVTLEETLNKAVKWDKYPKIESSEPTVLTFSATPSGNATRGTGKLNVTVENDGRESSGPVPFEVEYYN